MKGIELPTVAVVVIIIGIIILVIFIWWSLQGKASVDIVLAQNILRQCCSDRSIYDCASTDVQCKVPWDDTESLSDLATRAGIEDDQLPAFCGCT